MYDFNIILLVIQSYGFLKSLKIVSILLLGCDRHFLGLYMISVEEEIMVPSIFTDESWTKR